MNQTYLHYLLFALYKLIHKKHLIALSFIFLTGLVASSSVQAQTTPQQITYQGKLVQDGSPFSGSTTMIFELVNPTTNAITWTETQTINVQDGLYSVVLGIQTPFTSNFFSQNPSLGLRVSVNGNPLTPITVLHAVPYAHAAGSVADNSITSLKIVNGTIQTIDIASGGQNKILATDANGLVVWIDRTSITTPTPTLQQVLNTSNDAGNNKIINSATPTDPQDVANKAYVDAITGGSLQDLSTDATLLITGSGTYDGSNAETISVADGGITTNKIANGAVTPIKISPSASPNQILSTDANSIVSWQDPNIVFTETDPKVGTTLISGTLPVWNGTTLDNSSITDNGGDVEVNTSADFSVNAGGDVIISSSSGSVDINSTDTDISGNLTVNNDLIVNGVLEVDTNPFDEVITQSEVATFSSSDAQLMTGLAITDYVSTQIGSITETDPEVNSSITNKIPFWNGSQLVDGSISDDGTNLSTAGTFTFSNPNTIINSNNGFTNTLAFEPLTLSNKIITFPNASGTVLLEGNLSNNFVNGLATLSSDPSKIGLGGVLVENTSIDGNGNDFNLTNTANINFAATTSLTFNSPIIDATNTVFSIKNTVVGVPSFTSDATNTEFKTTAYINGNNSEFKIFDVTTANSLFNLYNTNYLNNLDIDLGTYNLGSATSAGKITMKAQDYNDASNLYEAATFLLEGGNADGLRGGHAILNGGNGGSDTKGTVFLQKDGGNVSVGSGSDSELRINGWLNLPLLDPPPTNAISNFDNLLYADNNGNLFWGDQNLSAGADTWEKIDANNIFYKGGTNSEVGIGAFSSTFDPLANLHIRKVATSADLKITTLRAAGETSKLYFQSATNNFGTATNSNISDILGEILFEGHDGTNFQEAAKIDVRATSANAATSEMRFFVDGTQKLSIHNDFDLNLGTTLTGPGGGVFLTAQSSDENTASSTGGYINMFAGSNIQPDGIGGNINIYAGGGGASGGNVDINAGGGLTRGLVMMQIGGGNVSVGNSSTNDSELQLNGFLTLPDLGSFSASPNNLYASGSDLFWGSTNLSAPTTNLVAGNGISDDGTNINLGGTALTADVTIDGNVNAFDFSLSNMNAISFNANSFSISPTPLFSAGTTGDVNIAAQSLITSFTHSAASFTLKGGAGNGGKATLEGGLSSDSNGGDVEVKGGNGASQSGKVVILGGDGSPLGGSGGNVEILGGDGISNGGDIIIQGGSASVNGDIQMQNIKGRVYIGNPTGGSGKLSIRTTENNMRGLSVIKDLVGSESTIRTISSGTSTGAAIEAIGNQGTTAIFQRQASGAAIALPVVNIQEQNNNATGNVLNIEGGNSTATVLSVNTLNINVGSKIVDFQAGGSTVFDINYDGSIWSNGGITLSSDRRYKKQINTLDNSLSNILSLRGTNYYWKDANKDSKLQFGVIAQEIEEVFPNLVHTNEEGYKSVNYIGLVPVLIEATKEQQTIIDNQKEEINTQKTELEALKKQINELKQIVASLQENENSKEGSNSALAQKVEALEKQLTALVESLTNKTETTTETASLKEEE